MDRRGASVAELKKSKTEPPECRQQARKQRRKDEGETFSQSAAVGPRTALTHDELVEKFVAWGAGPLPLASPAQMGPLLAAYLDELCFQGEQLILSTAPSRRCSTSGRSCGEEPKTRCPKRGRHCRAGRSSTPAGCGCRSTGASPPRPPM